jgi:hypothetical protein
MWIVLGASHREHDVPAVAPAGIVAVIWLSFHNVMLAPALASRRAIWEQTLFGCTAAGLARYRGVLLRRGFEWRRGRLVGRG